MTHNPNKSEKGKKMVNWYDRKPGRALSNHESSPLNQREISINRITNHTLCVKKDYLTDSTIRISKCSDVHKEETSHSTQAARFSIIWRQEGF